MRLWLICVFGILHFHISGQNMYVKNYISPEASDATSVLNELLKHNVDTIFFEEGVYNVSSLRLSSPIVLVGKKGTVLKRLPKLPKFSRLLTVTGEHSNKGVKLFNITFDGNISMQGDYSNYKLEQQHLVFVSGKKNKKGRTKVTIDNCNFINSAGDGVTAFVNSDVTILNSKAKDIYRGAFVCNGGNSIININNFEILKGDLIKDSGIDFEVIEAGNNGTKRVDAELKNILIQGKFQIGVSEDSHIIVDSIRTVFSDFYVSGRNSTVEITNSHFTINPDKKNRIYGTENLLVKDCTFLVDDRNTNNSDMVLIMWMNKNTQFKNNDIRFVNCSFAKTTDKPRGSVFIFETDKLINNNKLTLDNIKTDQSFDKLITTKRGGRAIIRNSDVPIKEPFKLGYRKNLYYQVKIENSKIETKHHKVSSSNEFIVEE